MPRKGRDLEKLIAFFEEQLIKGEEIKITSPEFIIGRNSHTKREIDVSLRAKVDSANRLVMLECRDRKGNEDVSWFDELFGKSDDVGANKVIAVSSSGFS